MNPDLDDEDSLGYVLLDEGAIKLYIATCNPEELWERGIIYVMNLENRETSYIVGKFMDDIKWYCENEAKNAYRPRVSELCFARYEGNEVL